MWAEVVSCGLDSTFGGTTWLERSPTVAGARTASPTEGAEESAMDISYTDLVEAEREGQMAICEKVAESVRALQSEDFSSVHEALEAAARIVESIGHSASTDAP